MPRKNARGEYIFPDFPEFRPNVSPLGVLKAGFGGTYFRPITYKGRKIQNDWKRTLPKSWQTQIKKLDVPWSAYDKNYNKYKVKCGQTYEYWVSKGWMRDQDPRGAFEWYVKFFRGRRSPDDARQVKRFIGIMGPTGRFRRRLVKALQKAPHKLNDKTFMPVIRQTLLHWGFEVKKRHLGER
jgi:hypothetical protein